MKSYILSFDRDPLNFDYTIIHEKIKNSNMIIDWFHYLLSSYILITEYSVKDLNKEIMKIMPDHKYFLTECNLENSNGYLPIKAYEWTKKYKNLEYDPYSHLL